jgi:hypothetical protein
VVRSLTLLLCLLSISAVSQNAIYSFQLEDVRITINDVKTKDHPILILYALPNGNTTEQTMGKQLKPGDDWHFDIQHIYAQTKFIRNALPGKRIIVAYLENTYKSWPLWKRNHADYRNRIPQIVDTIRSMFNDAVVYLNGHSGGGSFIFGFMDSFNSIPVYVERISFLDSNYGYDSTYTGKFKEWLQASKKHALNVFAYNDSVALLNGKPVVSATGGTWYKSHQMMRALGKFTQTRNDSVIAYKNKSGQVQFFFKTNPDRKIFHTTQVELNGFIHSILCGTKQESKNYKYYDKRAYTALIE